jgi:hypothetical protein
MFGDVAKALGMTEAQLHDQLEDGKTLAQIAKAKNKDLDDVKAAVKKAATARLDQAVKDGDITKAQRDDMLEHLDEHLENFGERPFGGRGRGHGPGMPPGDREDDESSTQNGAYEAPATGATRTD